MLSLSRVALEPERQQVATAADCFPFKKTSITGTSVKPRSSKAQSTPFEPAK